MLKNILAYAGFQSVNFILPLLTFPFFLRILDAEQIGVLAISTAINAYFLVVTEFGFNTTATKDIAIQKENKHYIENLYSSVFFIKAILLLILFSGLCLYLYFFKVKDERFYLLNFLSVVGISLYPIWFLQGLEKIKLFTGYNILIRGFFVLLILLFVKSKNDFFLIPILNGLGFTLSSVLSIVYISKRLGIKIKLVSFIEIKDRINKSLKIFYTRVLVSIYNASNVLILGIFTSDVVVAHYYVVDKVLFIAGAFFEPINQVIYPRMATLFRESKSKLKKVMNTYIYISLIYIIISLIVILFFSDWIVIILSGSSNIEIVKYLQKSLLILILIPFGPFISNILIIKGLELEFLKVIKITVIIDLLLVPVSVSYLKLDGLFYSYFLVLFIHVLLLINLNQKGWKFLEG